MSAELWVRRAATFFRDEREIGTTQKSKAVLTHRTPKLFPLASELERPLPNRLAERLVGGEGVEPFGLRLALVAQEVNQTQCLTLRSQLRLWSAPCQRSFGLVAQRLSLDDVECERC